MNKLLVLLLSVSAVCAAVTPTRNFGVNPASSLTYFEGVAPTITPKTIVGYTADVNDIFSFEKRWVAGGAAC